MIDTPETDPAATRAFFETEARHVLTAGQRANVRHHLLLSIIGVDQAEGAHYFRHLAHARREVLTFGRAESSDTSSHWVRGLGSSALSRWRPRRRGAPG